MMASSCSSSWAQLAGVPTTEPTRCMKTLKNGIFGR